MGAFKEVGRATMYAFWVTFVLGLLIAIFLYVGAPLIYSWYGMSQEIAALGVPFLRLRAIGVFFMFMYLAFIGFLRGIKNTKVPMQIFAYGIVVFVLLDYVLIFGKFGFPALGLQGSALASVIQYAFMLAAVLAYITLNKDVRRYSIELFAPINDGKYAKRLLMLSWPVVIDKALLAAAYIWLCKMISPMGTCAVATFCVVKDMERFAFLPAIASAQVITFLVSNDVGIGNWDGIKSNIKKIIFIASILVFSILLLFSLWPKQVIQLFDKKNDFTGFAARVFPFLSVLAFFDLLQLILSGALRGASDVKTVMMVRLVVLLGYFVPLSYLISQWQTQDQILKFILIYSSFYLGNALMSIVYINRFRGQEWKSQSAKGYT